MDVAPTIRTARLVVHVRPARNVLVGICAIERRIGERSCSAANPADMRGVSCAVHVLVRPVSGDEVSSGGPGEVSPVAGTESLDEPPAAAAWAGDVCLARRGADRRGDGAGIDALWHCAPRAADG